MTPLSRTSLAATLLGVLLGVVCAAEQTPGPQTESPSALAYRRAATLYENGKIAEALTAFHTFEAQYQFSAAVPQAIYFQGCCWARMQKFREAVNTFDRLRKGYPTTALIPEAILKQAECSHELKDYPTALGLYREFEANYPKHRMLSRAVLGEAWTNLQQGETTAARAALQRALAQFADDPVTVLEAQLLTGRVLTAENQFDAAVQVYGRIKADAYDVRASDGFFLAGEALFEAGQWSDAIDCYQRVQPRAVLTEHLRQQIAALQTQRGDYEQRLGDLLQLLAACEDGPDSGASALFRMANCYESLGRPEEAFAAYSQFLSHHPSDTLAEQARFGLIRTLVARRQFEEAGRAVADFQTRYPGSAFGPDISLLKAEAAFASGRTSEALDDFEKLAATNPRLPILETTEFRIGACRYALHDFDRARERFAAFVQEHSSSAMVPDALFRLGRCYVELSRQATDPAIARTDMATAIATYEQLRELHPTNALTREVIFQLGYLNASLASGNTDSADVSKNAVYCDKAVGFFREFLNRWADDPLVPEALYQLGRNQSAGGHFDDAIGSFRQVAEGFPNTTFAPLAAFEIAKCYGAEDKNQEMVTQFRSFVARYPAHPLVGSALYSIGLRLERESKMDEALAVYRDVIARAAASRDGTGQLRQAAINSEIHVAGILAARGDTAKAVAECEAFLAKFGDDPAAANAMIAQIADTYQATKQFDDGYACLDRLATAYQQNDAVRIATTTSTIELALAARDLRRGYAATSKLLADAAMDHLPPRSYIAIGTVLLQRGQPAQAREQYERSLRLYPNDALVAPQARLGIGRADLAMNRLDEAEDIFRQMVWNGPPGTLHDRASLGLAEVYLSRGGGDPLKPQTAKAIELLTSVMAGARGEDSGEAAYLLGNCYFAFTGDSKENKKTALAYYLRAALTISGPHGEEAAFRSGQCHKALGNPEVARRAFEAYLRRFPHGLFAADAKQELESLPAQPPSS
ncbi:MAG TPA: tetratricopeptide repeat protein [Verrucomicrobiae bacterium]|nr:tetratricopeptide repeat protein [Verrucomicrobiae bacterium]